MATQTPKSDLVCATCHARLFNPSSFHQLLESRITYTTTWKEITSASGSGCGWCDMIHYELDFKFRIMMDEEQTKYQGGQNDKAIAEDILNNPATGIVIAVSIRDEDGSSMVYIQFENTEEKGGKAWGLSCITASAAANDEAARVIKTRPLIYEMASDKTFKLARAYIDECVRCEGVHVDCPRPIKPALPTRVLDCDDTSNPTLKTNTTGIDAPYVALSYVWGEDQPQKTTSANISRYSSFGLDRSSIPRTIADAVQATKELGFRYLWVDSYCIIQDSSEDKAIEIRNMRNIFRNARLTLIAAKTDKVTKGFLQDCPRPEAFVVPFGDMGSMILSPRAWDEPYEADKEPTNLRGWCLEERILTPRALVYASNTLQFLCQKGLVNMGGSYTSRRRTGVERLTAEFFQSGNVADELPKLIKLWHGVLQDFTPRQLTDPPDRLKAIAGVAEEFHLRLESRYIAGMWERHLVGDLLWSKNGSDPLPSPKQYRAPSWSWASVDGIVYYPFGVVDQTEVRCEVLECNIDLARPNFPYGAVKGGHIKIKGKLVKVHVMWEFHRQLVRAPSGDVLGVGQPDRLEDDNPDGKEEEGWALPLVIRQPNLKPGFSVRDERMRLPRMGGLLLKQEKDTECYRRFALFDLRITEEAKGIFGQAKEEVLTIV